MKALIYQLPVDQLKRSRFQPRRNFDAPALQELADSIDKNGLIQPIVVRPEPGQTGEYEIVAGERRWRAAQLVGLTEITCLVKNYTDEQAAAVTTIENWQRENLNPIEMAHGLQQLIDEFDYLHEEVAAIISCSRSKVTNLLRLLQLAMPVQQLLMEGKLTEGHGKILAGLPKNLQLSLAQRALEQAWSVRKTEQMAKQMEPTLSVIEKNQQNPNLKRLERIISEQLAAPVVVDPENSTGGWLKIKFYDNETLVGLLEKIGISSEHN